MNEPLSTTNSSGGRDFGPADHWRFSTETSLLIPELLRGLGRQLQWRNLKLFGELNDRDSIIRADFTRRILTDPEHPDDRVYQFTYSNHFVEYSASEAIDDLKGCLKKACELFDVIGKFDKREPLTLGEHTSSVRYCIARGWRQALTAFEKASHDRSDRRMVERLKILAADSFSLDHEEEQKVFDNLTLLYEFYSRIPVKGYLTELLDNEHFKYNCEDNFKQGRPRTLAYLLQVDASVKGGKLPPVEAFWRIDNAGKCINLRKGQMPQPEGKFFPSVANASEVEYVGELHKRLWAVFNSESGTPPEHLLAIPVYCRDDISSKNMEDQLCTQGAFLGWFFLQFPEENCSEARSVLDFMDSKTGDKPCWISDRLEQEPKNKIELSGDLRHIRHALNDFAERYLQREMEWALKREFKRGQSALDYVVSHYHHCGGWVGAYRDIRAMPKGITSCYALFCRESDDKTELISLPTHKEPWRPDLVDYLLVNVSFDDQSNSTDMSSSRIICLKRRRDTALSEIATGAREYGHHVAETVRTMFNSATYVAKVQEKENVRTLNDISHEVKHVAQSLEAGWMTHPDSLLLSAIGQFYNRKGLELSPNKTLICPFPHLIKAAGRLIQFWTGTRDPIALFDTKPQDIRAVFTGLWRVVTDAALALASSRYGLTKNADVEEILRYERVINETWNMESFISLTSDRSIPLPGQYRNPTAEKINSRDDRMWLIVFEILLSKFTDVLKHADPKKPIKVVISEKKRCLKVIIEDAPRPLTDDCSDADSSKFHRELAERMFFRSEHEGNRIVRGIAEDNNDFVTWSDPTTDLGGNYKHVIIFNWPPEQGKKQ